MGPVDFAGNETFPFAFSIAPSNGGTSLDARAAKATEKNFKKDPAKRPQREGGNPDRSRRQAM